uniref:Uncharacterized protein n=1 Tax=Panagrolaimus sp. JU765 TaxID=591449 RepID=A0AC34QHN2_9BILA
MIINQLVPFLLFCFFSEIFAFQIDSETVGLGTQNDVKTLSNTPNDFIRARRIARSDELETAPPPVDLNVSEDELDALTKHFQQYSVQHSSRHSGGIVKPVNFDEVVATSFNSPEVV